MTLAVLLLIVLLSAFGASAWTLAADGPGAGFLRKRLPLPLIGWMHRAAGWFDAGETVPVGAPVTSSPPPASPPPPPRLDKGLPMAPARAYGGLPASAPPAAAVPGINGTLVPADHAMVHMRIATFEPEDEAALLAFYGGEANAAHGQAEAWLAHADVLVNGIGLDPAFAQAVVMLSEAHADMAEVQAMVQGRLAQVYALVKEHLAGGGTLPFDGDFITGDV